MVAIAGATHGSSTPPGLTLARRPAEAGHPPRPTPLARPGRSLTSGRVRATAALLIDAASIALPPSVSSPDVQRHDGEGTTTVLFATVLEATRCLDSLTTRPSHPGCVMLPVDTGAVGAHAAVLDRGRAWLVARPGEQVVSAALAPLVAPLLPRRLELAPLVPDDGVLAESGVVSVLPTSAAASGPTVVDGETMYAVRPRDPRRTSSRAGLTWARRVVRDGLDDTSQSAAFPAGVRVAHVHGSVTAAVLREVAHVALGADAVGRQVLFADAAADGAEPTSRLGAIRRLCAGYVETLEPAELTARLGADLAPLADLDPRLPRALGLEDHVGVVGVVGGVGHGRSGLADFDVHLRALLAVVAAAPTLLVIASVEHLDASSCVLLERVVTTCGETRLLTAGAEAHPTLEKRLRRRLGREHLVAIAADRLRGTAAREELPQAS